MKNLYIICLLLANYVFAQDTTSTDCSEINKGKIFTIVEMMPHFEGGDSMLNRFITENLRYPPDINTLPGNKTVYVTFAITKDGTICNPKIIGGLRKDIDDEALRVVKLMPKWIPGRQNGKLVNVQYQLPIKFVLK